MGELRRAGMWGQKRLGRRRTLSTGYRDLESCQEKVRAGGRLGGGVVLGQCLGKAEFEEEEEAKSLAERKSLKTALGG